MLPTPHNIPMPSCVQVSAWDFGPRPCHPECAVYYKVMFATQCCVRWWRNLGASFLWPVAFASAPFAHRFQHPALHARHLRVMGYAESRDQHEVGLRHMTVLSPAVHMFVKHKEELRKQLWSEFHDLTCPGIHGLLPLVAARTAH